MTTCAVPDPGITESLVWVLGLTCDACAAVQKPTEAALINQFEQTTGGAPVETAGSVTFQQVTVLLAGMEAELPSIHQAAGMAPCMLMLLLTLPAALDPNQSPLKSN